MSIQQIPRNASSFPRNVALEEKVLEYLEKNKGAFTLLEVAEAIKAEPLPTRRALFNLRNDKDIVEITFQTNEIHWMHKNYIPRK